MRLGVHIGVYTDGDRRFGPHGAGDLGQRPQFRLAFHVELADAAFQRHAHLLARLADAGKDDAVAGDACRLRLEVFADGHDIGPRTEESQGTHHGGVRRRLHGEADQMVHALQCLIEQAIVPL